jgi:hypothetical protein
MRNRLSREDGFEALLKARAKERNQQLLKSTRVSF